MKMLDRQALGIALALLAPGCAETLGAAPAADASTDAPPLAADAGEHREDIASVDVPTVDAGAPMVAVDVPDAGPACGRSSINVNDYGSRDGGYRLSAEATTHSGVGQCQTWQGGGDRWMRFRAPVAGLWRVSARGSNLWSFSAHRACEGAGTEVACQQFTDYHSSNPFSRPLTFDLELAAGETTWLLASGCLGGACSWAVEIAPPVTVEGRCRFSGAADECREGWFCSAHTGLPSGVGQCVEATAPTLREASVFEWDGTLRVRVHGVDTSRDTASVEAELFGRDGARLSTATGHLTVDGGDDFIGRAHIDPGARVLTVGVAAVELTLVDRRGLRSTPLRVMVRPPVIADPGQPCDPAGVDDVCPAAHRCGTAEWGGNACVHVP